MKKKKVIDQATTYNNQAESFAKKGSQLVTWTHIGRRAFDELLPITGSESIIDLGCGSGRVVEYLLERGANPALITGVEISDKEVDIARQKLPHIAFQVGDITNVELPENQFDVAISHMVFEHLDDEALQATMGNAFRMLKPDGRFVFVVTHPDKITASDGITEQGWFETTAPWGGMINNYFRRVDDFRRIVRKAGFVINKELELGIPDDAKWHPDYEKYKRYGNIRLAMDLLKNNY